MTETTTRQQLMEAIGHNCHCVWDAEGSVSTVCALHQAFSKDEELFTKRMEFARFLCERWLDGEGLERSWAK